MNGITKQTRRQSYDGIRTRSGERCKLILETLGNRSMTVEEITDELVAADGGLWKSQAVDNVKNYLAKALADVPDREKITIIA